MEPENTPQEPRPNISRDLSTTRVNRLSAYLGSLRAFFADRRVSISGLLLFAYAAGIVSAFYIRDSHPVAIVHPGPYALVAIYKGNVYELVPMEDSVRHRHTDTRKQKSKIDKIEKIGQVEPSEAHLDFPKNKRSPQVTDKNSN